MRGQTLYPPADHDTQWFGDSYPGAVIVPTRTVWHTTETPGWPSYDGGSKAPGWTYHPKLRRWRQHFWADRSSRALKNLEGGVETNTLGAHQVEIVAYSEEGRAAAAGGIPVSRLSSANLDDLAAFAAWQYAEWGVELDVDPGWVRADYTTPRRMSATTWRAFAGHTGHNRVPENTHWDPARLDIDAIITRARELTDMPTAQEIANALLATPIKNRYTEEPDDTITIRAALEYLYARVTRTERTLDDHANTGLPPATIEAIVDAIGAGIPPDLARRVVVELGRGVVQLIPAPDEPVP